MVKKVGQLYSIQGSLFMCLKADYHGDAPGANHHARGLFWLLKLDSFWYANYRQKTSTVYSSKQMHWGNLVVAESGSVNKINKHLIFSKLWSIKW
jgi:hypothetical protein